VIQRHLLLRKLGLAGAALLCLALLLEVAARLLLAPARYHDAPLHYDPLLGFRGIPGLRVERFDAEGAYPFELNAQGFRGRSLPAGPAPEGTLRIVFLGDSFLVGEGVRAEALLTSRLEMDLSARGFDAEVYNLSAIDYGTTQQLMLLDEYGPRIHPDVVVLAFFTGNDVINNALELAGRSIVSRGDPLRPWWRRSSVGCWHWGSATRSTGCGGLLPVRGSSSDCAQVSHRARPTRSSAPTTRSTAGRVLGERPSSCCERSAIAAGRWEPDRSCW